MCYQLLSAQQLDLAGMLRHYLQPLLAPRSVALVGATEREGALGRIVWQNLAAGGLRGGLYPVNLKHRQVFGQAVARRLSDLAGKVDLAVVVTPAASVPPSFSGPPCTTPPGINSPRLSAVACTFSTISPALG